MDNIYSTFIQSGATIVNIQLWHIWAFILIVSGMIVIKSVRSIAIVSLLAAVLLGWQDSLTVVEKCLPASPAAVGGFYLLFGALILASVACTFDLDN